MQRGKSVSDGELLIYPVLYNVKLFIYICETGDFEKEIKSGKSYSSLTVDLKSYTGLGVEMYCLISPTKDCATGSFPFGSPFSCCLGYPFLPCHAFVSHAAKSVIFIKISLLPASFLTNPNTSIILNLTSAVILLQDLALHIPPPPQLKLLY